MKYFFDTEFIEGFHKPMFGKRRHFIDLISIGIVSEDGREYYAISNEFNPKDADEWVVENVINKIEVELYQRQNIFAKTHFNLGLDRLLKKFGKSNLQIAREVKDFCGATWFIDCGKGITEQSEFYAYYADYDWVVFCSLFGRMINLPKGFPMYCKDLKQVLDEKCLSVIERIKDNKNQLINGEKRYDGFQPTLDGAMSCLKENFNYPNQANEHNALDDAKWNKELFNFIESLD